MNDASHGKDRVTIYVGDVHAAAHPTEVRTLLGSCIAVCLFDPSKSIGGMNHFLLPEGSHAADEDPTRFGVYAIDDLIGKLMMLGADRRRMVAKVFGGAHVLGMRESDDGVPQRNVKFARGFLQDEGFKILAEDVGGYQPRIVVFSTSDGKARVKRLARSGMVERVARQHLSVPAEPPKFGDVTLF